MSRAVWIQLVVIKIYDITQDIVVSASPTLPVRISPLFIASFRLRGSKCRAFRHHVSAPPTVGEEFGMSTGPNGYSYSHGRSGAHW
jgi:hypothetical protein